MKVSGSGQILESRCISFIHAETIVYSFSCGSPRTESTYIFGHFKAAKYCGFWDEPYNSFLKLVEIFNEHNNVRVNFETRG
jgi:hypothetical protein